MPRVFLHTYENTLAEPRNEGRDFLRLPCVGEYLTTAFNSPWYEVKLVVHCPFEGEYAAEVFAVVAPQGQEWIVNTHLRAPRVPVN